MVFPIVGGNESKGYEVENSLRFNASDSPQLSKDMSSLSATSTKKFTTSFWLKPGNVPQTSYGGIIDVGGDHAISLVSDNTFYFFESGGSDLYWRPTRVFRDPSAWYNIIIIADSTLSTQTDRVKIYVNGVIETSFHNNSGPSQNHDFAFNTSNTRYIGRKQTTSSSLDGYLTEIHHIDGQAKAHTDFGKFDDNRVWIPIKYDGTYGNTGYYLEFQQTGTSQNSSGIGADTSGNDNHFAVSNLAAQDITEDTCTNNFATLNSVDHRVEDATLSEGNCKFVGSNGNDGGSTSTIGVTSGKWYAEFKFLNNHKSRVGIIDQTGHDTNGNNVNDGVHYDFTGGYIYATLNGTGNDTGDNSTSGGYDVTDGSTNDILGVALDADNEKVLFTLNGTTLGQEGDGFTNLQRQNTGETFFFHVRDGSGSGDDEPQIVCNFGNPPPDFSISSGNTDGKYGNFEYAPPSGFYALCTKRLAEFG